MNAVAMAFVLFLGFAGWGLGILQVGPIAGGGDDGRVTAMEDSYPPPRP